MSLYNRKSKQRLVIKVAKNQKMSQQKLYLLMLGNVFDGLPISVGSSLDG